jgi:hypothetical protein
MARLEDEGYSEQFGEPDPLEVGRVALSASPPEQPVRRWEGMHEGSEGTHHHAEFGVVLGASPPEQPATCPTCGVDMKARGILVCPDPWHASPPEQETP